MKKFSLALPLLLLVLALPLHAQTRFGVRAGVTDGNPMIGGELLVPVTGAFMANPNIEVTSKLITGNVDFHYDFRIDRESSWWVGAGLAAIKPDHGDSGFGVNILGGYGRKYQGVYPYAQLRFTSANKVEDYVSAAVGVRF